MKYRYVWWLHILAGETLYFTRISHPRCQLRQLLHQSRPDRVLQVLIRWLLGSPCLSGADGNRLLNGKHSVVFTSKNCRASMGPAEIHPIIGPWPMVSPSQPPRSGACGHGCHGSSAHINSSMCSVAIKTSPKPRGLYVCQLQNTGDFKEAHFFGWQNIG